ncbi:MAG: PVC-type heme-binding CxxCH protein [Deltaproteobacteria bacterium]
MRIWLLGSGLVAACLLSCGPAAAQQIPHGQDKPPGPALTPAEAVKKMVVPPGFSVEVVAAEPDLVNPVAMTFDERGTIWVTESLEYPRSEPGPGRDRVKRLEDTDGDGRADKITVFADGLNIPSGIAVGYGGVWVANSPDILFLQDTDGDGKADKSEVVVTGFGRTDTHELPNSLTWGPDGWLYGLNGVFNFSHVKYPRSSPHYREDHPGWKFTCAMFRIHPRTREFQVFCEGTSNPWGIAFDTEGSAFVSACVIDHLWHLVETGYYHRQGGPYPPFTWKIESIVKHKHQKAAYCGLHFFDSDAYPERYREKLYMGNIHGNCINSDKLQRDGSTYFATPEPDFLSANDAWFMPVVQKTGPDGCLYILDWYDQYHCYQDARRDPAGIERAKGRLYRVRYNDTPRAPKFDLTKETDDQLIERLRSPNVYFRDIAQRLLAERNEPKTRVKLYQIIGQGDTPRKSRLHALWALLGMGNVEEDFLTALFTDSEDPTVLAWCIRAAGNMGRMPGAMRIDVDLQMKGNAPEILLQQAIAARKIEGERGMPLLLDALNRCGDDKLIPYIVWQNLHPLLERNPDGFLNFVKDADLRNRPQLVALLRRATDRILARQDPNPKPIADLFAILESRDTSAARQCLGLLAALIQNGEIQGDRLEALRRQLAPLIAAHVRAGAAHPLGLDAALVAVSWKDDTALNYVRETFKTAGAAPELRLRALGALISAGDKSLLENVAAALAAKAGPAQAEFRGQVLAALGRLDDPKVADVVLGAYKDLELDVQPKAVELLTQRAAWAKALLAAIGKRQVPAEALGVNQVRKLLASRDPELVKAVQSQWGTIREERNPKRDAIIAEMRTLIRKDPGDPYRGQEVFKKVCGQCHKIYGEGQEVGPDITVNGRSSFEQLLSNVFDPSLVIGASYQARTIVTTQGRVVTGLVAEESDQRVVLKVQGGKQEVVPRGEIDEMKTSELSLMPEDLEKTLKPNEIADLFAFITLDKLPSDPAARQLPGVREVVPRDVTDPAQFAALVAEVAPGFTTAAVGERGVGLLKEHFGRPLVIRTHPVKQGVPCILTRTVDLPAGKKSKLRLSAAHDRNGDWQLIVKANGQKLYDGIIGPGTAKNGWVDLEIDLSEFAGKKVALELHNHPNNWSNEFGYWGRVEIVTN